MAAIWTRINTTLLLLVLRALLAVIGLLATGVRGGPLDPPGAPGATDSVKLPGTPISSIPYTITESGSYYLTRNLTAVSGDGITINADFVTLDLMGFALTGPGSGITSNPATTRRNNAIRNGIIRGWAVGVDTRNFIRSTYEDLRVTDSLGAGLIIGSGNSVLRVMAAYNLYGLVTFQRDDALGGSVADSNFSRNDFSGIEIAANNIWVRDSVIDSNGRAGIYLNASANASYNQITDNRISGNGGGLVPMGGVYISGPGANANLIARNVLLGNAPAAVTDVVANGNRIGPFVGGDTSIAGSNPWSNVVY